MKFLNKVSWILSCSASANFPVIGLQNLQNSWDDYFDSWVFLSWLYISKLYLLDSSFIYSITSFMEVQVLIHHRELQYIYPYNVPKHIYFIITPHLKLPIYLQLTEVCIFFLFTVNFCLLNLLSGLVLSITHLSSANLFVSAQ